MFKRVLALITAFLMVVGMSQSAFAASTSIVTGELSAAERLSHLGLFMGVGINPDGTLDFALDRHPTRLETAIMFVRLIGGSEEAYSRVWTVPFTDVPSWGLPYIGYAVHNNLIFGVSPTHFGANDVATSYQFVTLVLRALGYSSSEHFDWQAPWILSDQKGITNGRFNAATRTFTRGDIAEISLSALEATFANSSITLAESLINAGVFTVEQAQFAGVPFIIRDGLVVAPTPTPTPVASPVPSPSPMPGASPAPSPSPLPSPVPTSVSVSPASATINVGATQTITATVMPANAINRTVTWTSSNTNVATVSSTGVVTGGAAGTAIITATTSNGLTATSTITVAAVAIDAAGFERRVFELTNEQRRNHGLPDLIWDDRLAQAARVHSIDMATNNLMAHIGSDGSTVGTRLQRVGVTNWSSWAENVASHATPEAVIQAWMNSPGHRANILSSNTHLGVGFDNTSGRTRFTQKFVTLANVPAQILPSSVTVSPSTINLNIGETENLAANVTPANAADRSVAWQSSNSGVAAVSNTGVVTAVSAGTATITATTVNGLTATATVTVLPDQQPDPEVIEPDPPIVEPDPPIIEPDPPIDD